MMERKTSVLKGISRNVRNGNEGFRKNKRILKFKPEDTVNFADLVRGFGFSYTGTLKIYLKFLLRNCFSLQIFLRFLGSWFLSCRSKVVLSSSLDRDNKRVYYDILMFF